MRPAPGPRYVRHDNAVLGAGHPAASTPAVDTCTVPRSSACQRNSDLEQFLGGCSRRALSPHALPRIGSGLSEGPEHMNGERCAQRQAMAACPFGCGADRRGGCRVRRGRPGARRSSPGRPAARRCWVCQRRLRAVRQGWERRRDLVARCRQPALVDDPIAFEPLSRLAGRPLREGVSGRRYHGGSPTKGVWCPAPLTGPADAGQRGIGGVIRRCGPPCLADSGAVPVQHEDLAAEIT
jgi:hypothetical protein